MYSYDQIRAVHLEVTNKCNASCPQCPRSDHGGPVNSSLSLTELTLDDVRQIFPWEFAKNLRSVLLCGNYGDAIMAEEVSEICEFFREVSPKISIGIHTNGSARTMLWWRRLAIILSEPSKSSKPPAIDSGGQSPPPSDAILSPSSSSYVRFGLDGLADTNHIYRRGTKWKTIMNSARAFIGAGGRAEWNFIVFKHNEHQVEQAEALSKEMGFASFRVRKTPRFFDWDTLEARSDFAIKDKYGDVVGKLEAPSAEWTNSAVASAESLTKKHGSLQLYFDQTEIACQAMEESSIYVSADGHVVPCCYLGSRDLFLRQMEKLGYLDKLNVKKYTLREIVGGPIFQRGIPDGWSKGPGRNPTCAKFCGSEFRPSRT